VSISPGLLGCTLPNVAASATGISGRLTGDVTDGPEAHRDLDVPTDYAIRLGTDSKQVHLALTVLDPANGKVAISVEPLLDETFG
jgi:hypothetical protein